MLHVTDSLRAHGGMLDGPVLTYAVMAVGSLSTAVFLLVPPGSIWQVVAWLVPFLLGAGLLGVRVAAAPSWSRGPLSLLLAAALLYSGGSAVWYVGPVWLDYQLSFPSPLDTVFFAAYSGYAAFLIAVLRRRASEANSESRLALADAGVLTAALSAVLWMYVIEPNLDDDLPRLATFVAVLYPGFQLLLFGLGVRLVMSFGLRKRGVTMPLLLWLGTELVADVFYGFQSANGTFDYQAPLTSMWLVSFTGLALLAAHPGVVDLLQPRDRSLRMGSIPEEEPSGAGRGLWHVVLLAAALVPLILAEKTPGNDPMLMVVAGAMFALVLYRFTVVAGDLAKQRKRVADLHQKVAEKNDALEEFNRLLRQQSRQDPLTGLGNRLRLDEDLNHLRDMAERYGHLYCLVLCDLDRFKAYNDRYGHPAGDEALRQVGQALSKICRPGDTAYRYGGEELLAILPEQSLAGGLAFAERLRRSVQDLGIPHDGNSPASVVTLSVGIAALDEGPVHQTPAELMRKADTALYRAKSTGRNKVSAEDGSNGKGTVGAGHPVFAGSVPGMTPREGQPIQDAE